MAELKHRYFIQIPDPVHENPVRVPSRRRPARSATPCCYRIASAKGGKDQPFILQMLERPLEKAHGRAQGRDDGTEDCAFPLLAGMVGTDDAEVAFKDADIALLVARVRADRHGTQGICCLRTPGSVTAHGAALNQVASRA